MRTRSFPRALSLGIALVLGAAVAAAQEPAPPPDAPADPRAQALARFEKGNALFKAGETAAALAEFLEARRLYPRPSSTGNAALCLTSLGRFDEALDLYEALLREFPDLSADVKAPAQREVVRLRGLVGTVDLAEAEIGAAITVDGQSRGEFPPLAPLRVNAGSHVVRVYKEGFEPFEERVDVAGGATARVVARPRVLGPAGRLRVVERDGRSLTVVVDGSEVGKTPWEGPVPAGEHTVLLRSRGVAGTQPVSVPVNLGQLTPLKLVTEEVAAWIRVEPTPAAASVGIDGVNVGRGVWEGRLREGAHRIEVSAQGFVPGRREVTLGSGESRVLAVELRELDTGRWRRPARFMMEITGAAALSPSLGGDVLGGCDSSCGQSVAAGGQGALHLGYELGAGLGFGLTAGYLQMSQATSDRATSLRIKATSPNDVGTASDTLTARGFFAGAWAGFSGGERFRFHVRLGAGGVAASVSDTRTGTFVSGAELENTVGPITVRSSASFVYVAPELRAGILLGDHFELTAGLAAMILVGAQRPVWTNPKQGYYATVPLPPGEPARGYFGTFPAERLAGEVLVALLPGLGARYDF